ncbi:hypothetical protein [Aquipuribacter nitratireducens]|uniref:DUF5753 domain-containing protein n=1 Tax=Aquipuribacter nitratireducens TaxID=650104 RepID=A0ABW0GSD6_9MICO
MSQLADLWRAPSFREALTAILTSDGPLYEKVRARLDDPSPPVNTYEQDSDHTTEMGMIVALATAEALVAARNIDGIDQVIDDLEHLFPEDKRAIARERTRALLEDTPSEKMTRLVEGVRNTALPILEASSVQLDFRTVYEPGDGVLLVPVFLARLAFDEAAVTGNVAVFQFDLESFEELSSALERAKRRLAEAREFIPRTRLIGTDAEGLTP